MVRYIDAMKKGLSLPWLQAAEKLGAIQGEGFIWLLVRIVGVGLFRCSLVGNFLKVFVS